MLGRARLILWVLVGLAALGVAGLIVTAQRQSSPVIANRTAPPAPLLGAPFTLTAADGSRFSSKTLAGKPYAMFFGFTHCPDVCPTTMARLAKLRRQLGQGDDAFQIVFVSVDPERDTPAALAPYAGLFDTPLIALTGSVAEIEAVKTSHGIYSAKAPLPGGGYSVDHSSAVLLFDRAGQFVATIATDEGDKPALAKLGRITA